VLKIHPCLHAFLHDGAIPEHRLQLRPMHLRVYEGQRTLSRVDMLEPQLRLPFLRITNTCLSPSMAVSPAFAAPRSVCRTRCGLIQHDQGSGGMLQSQHFMC
jgi:hypothetical protein